MAIFIPVLQTEYLPQRFFYTKTMRALVSSGVLDARTLAQAYGAKAGGVSAGDIINVPRFNKLADFEWTDINSTTPQNGTAVSTNDDKAVVLRDHTLNTFKRADVIRSGENLGEELMASLSDVLAKRVVSQTFRVLSGALGAMTNTAHTRDRSGHAITVDDIRIAKSLLGDEAERLTTLVIHPVAWSALQYDMIHNYNNNAAVAGSVVIDGRTQAILGISDIIITNQAPVDTGSGDTTTGDDVYSTFLLAGTGPNLDPDNPVTVGGCLDFIYQAEPEQEAWEDIRTPSTINYLKVSMDYITHLKGMKWTGSTNPQPSDLSNPSNWGVAYTDAREVGAAVILSSGANG